MYKVIKAFNDLMDTTTVKGGKIPYRYEIGDMYPRPGAKPSMARIAELSGSQNLQGTPLIAPITPPVTAPVEAIDDKVEEVPVEKVKKPRKRRKADAKQD